jgi:hypothetical protein
LLGPVPVSNPAWLARPETLPIYTLENAAASQTEPEIESTTSAWNRIYSYCRTLPFGLPSQEYSLNSACDELVALPSVMSETPGD